MQLLRNELDYDYFLKDRFISGAFLQSSIWRDFLKAQKKQYWQTAVFKKDELIALCLFYQNELPFDFSYLYAPKGPIISLNLTEKERKEALFLILSQAREVSVETKKKEEIFFKFEPSDNFLLREEFLKEKDVQPKETWIIDLKSSENNLLSLMHSKTRYNINLARKKGLKVRFSQKEEDLKYFLKLIKQTSKRNKIICHSDVYYQLLFKTIIKRRAGYLALAELEDKILAVNLIINFGSTTTYLHGGSDNHYRNFMAPHLLQWETIIRAKKENYRFYDFWGVAPQDGSKPSWQGISRFKKSFGGKNIAYPGAYNLIYSNTWYNLYNSVNRVRTLLRGFKK